MRVNALEGWLFADVLGIGEEGAAQSGSGERTVLQFAALSAVEISRFSALGDAAEEEHGSDNGFVNEDEVLLLPGTRFKIDKITKCHFWRRRGPAAPAATHGTGQSR